MQRAIFICLLIVTAFLMWSCHRGEVSGGGKQAPVVLTREDSLWFANDYAELGFDRYSYEEHDSGLVYFELALKFDSTHSQAWHGLALMLDHFDRELEAEQAYRQAEKFDSTNKQAIWHLGCHYARVFEKEKALRQLRTVIALDSSYAIGVVTENCWELLWDDPDFLAVVSAADH